MQALEAIMERIFWDSNACALTFNPESLTHTGIQSNFTWLIYFHLGFKKTK